jgi:hypothetical protein
VFISLLTEIANSSDSPQGLRVLARSAIESATALDVVDAVIPSALRQAQSIEDITLRVTIQQAIISAFIDQIEMTAEVTYAEIT